MTLTWCLAKEAGVPKDYRNMLGNWGDADMADLFVNSSNLNNTLLLSEQKKITNYIALCCREVKCLFQSRCNMLTRSKVGRLIKK